MRLCYRWQILSTICIALLGVSAASAQQGKTMVGIGVGYDYASARLVRTDDTCHCNPSYEGMLHQTLAFVEVSVPDFIDEQIGVNVRLRGNTSMWKSSRPLPEKLVYIRPSIYQKVEERISFQLQTIQLDLLACLTVVKRLQLSIGPTVGYQFVHDYRRISYLLDPVVIKDLSSPGPFPDERRIKVLDDDSSLNQNHFALGALLTASYKLSLSDRFSLVPELRLHSDFISPIRNAEWKALSAGGAIVFAYSL